MLLSKCGWSIDGSKVYWEQADQVRGQWHPAIRQESNKSDKWCQFAQDSTTTTTTTFSSLTLSQQPISQVHLLYQLHHRTPHTPTSPHPSIPSLEDWAAIIEHSSVYRSTLPIGFWINGIIFLIKQDGATARWGWQEGWCRSVGVWAEDPAIIEPAWGLLQDVMTVWQFGECDGLGEAGRVGGWIEEKPMPTDGMEGGELIDLLSVFSSEDQRQTEALVFIV